MSGTDDLASLPDLNEEIILEKLKKRYQNDAIYVISNIMEFLRITIV